MFTIDDLKQTRFYQDARQEGEIHLVLRQLNRLTQSIQNLEISQIDELADQLLDFTSILDLESWLNTQAQKSPN